MPDYRIPASAKRRAIEAHDEAADRGQLFDDCMEAALRAAFDELGMTGEYLLVDQTWRNSYLLPKQRHTRLVSRWMPVNDVVEESE